MGRPRKITSVKQLNELWEKYKEYCNNQMVLTHDFSSKNSEFVSKELRRSVTYTIEGFCVFIGISRSAFYEYYGNNDRMKFELQMIPSQLAGLWMSNYGYTTKMDTNVSGMVPVEIIDDIPKEDADE